MQSVITICILASVFPATFCSSGESVGPGEKASREVLNLQPFTPAADFFPILCWDGIPTEVRREGGTKKALESIADCGFTVAGFVTPEDLPLCEKLGVTAIVRLPSSVLSEKLAEKQVDELVTAVIRRTAASKALLGYFVMDEPKVENFPAVARVVAAVKRHAPGKLAYVDVGNSYVGMSNPKYLEGHRAMYTTYLERFVAEVRPQFLSYDNYMVQFSDDLQNANAAIGYYNDLLECRRIAQKYGLPFWNIVASGQIREWTTIPSPANLAFQAYTTLAAGGRGLAWYTYYPGTGYAYTPVDGTGNKNDTWRYLQAVNGQIQVLGPIVNRLRSTGVFFTSPPPAKSLPVLPGRAVKRIQARASVQGVAGTNSRHSLGSPPTPQSKASGIAAVDQPIMVGEFVDEHGSDHVMLVNINLKSSVNVKWETTKAYKSQQIRSAIDGRRIPLPLDNANSLWLPAGQGVLVELK